MKNVLKYFYNLYYCDIHYQDKYYKIIYKSDIFIFMKCDNKYFLDIYNYLHKLHMYCHEIILNKDKSVFTIIDGVMYVLLKVNIFYRKIDIEDIIKSNLKFSNGNICHWYDLWCKKIDYYEYHISQFKKKYPLLSECFNYYCSLVECALSILGNNEFNNVAFYINHNRIYKNSDVYDFYNPINMILDVKTRDVAEYFKTLFFYSECNEDCVINYFIKGSITRDEASLFLVRMLYPSYYFDMYDLIIQEKINENKIKIIVDKIDDYEVFLKKIYLFLKKRYDIIAIDWLESN